MKIMSEIIKDNYRTVDYAQVPGTHANNIQATSCHHEDKNSTGRTQAPNSLSKVTQQLSLVQEAFR